MSLSHRDLREILHRELRNAGIKGEDQRTEGGHFKLNFMLNGKPDFILTSWTPGDHRVAMNSRAQLRRKLRAAGVLDKAAPPKTALGKALSLPIPTEPFADRIAKLEDEVATLLDMYADLLAGGVITREKLHETVAAVAPPAAAPLPVEQLPPSFPVAKTKRMPRGEKNKMWKGHDLLLCVDYDWTPTRTIIERMKGSRTDAAIGVALDKLKKEGKVENQMPAKRGWWRKVRQKDAEIAALTAEIEKPKAPTLPAPAVSPLLAAMSFAWMPKGEIEKRLGFGGTKLSTALAYQKKLGLVENNPLARGMWRKVRQDQAVLRVHSDVQAPPAPRVPTPQAPQVALLDHLEFSWLSLTEIAQRCGYGDKKLTNALQYQKRVGNVERGDKGMWRKRRPHTNGNAAQHRMMHSPAD